MNIRKTNLIIIKIIVIICLSVIFKDTDAQGFKEVIKIPWNTEEGISSEKFPEANTGISDFVLVDSTRIAILCNSDNMVKIYDLKTKKKTSEFKCEFDDTFITYDSGNQIFYLSSLDKVIAYKQTGSLQRTIQFDYPNILITGLIFIENDLFINGGQNYYTIIQGGYVLSELLQNKTRTYGQILTNGTIVKYSNKLKDGTVTISLLKDNTTSEYIILTGENSHGMVPVDIWDNILILKEYFHKGEQYSNIYNRLVFYSTDYKKIITQKEIPNIRYTSHRKDFNLCNNKLYNLITTPQYALLLMYDLQYLKTVENPTIEYPSELNYEYHYNIGYK